ncbi:MAG: peptidylprolyl isomerase [Planctomycetaceae bacterium]
MDFISRNDAGGSRRVGGLNRGFACRIVGLFLVGMVSSSQAEAPKFDATVATVNGVAIKESEVQFAALIRGIPEAELSRVREQLVDQLVSQKLMGEFLKKQKVEAAVNEIDDRLAVINDQIRQAGREPAEVFAKLGLQEKDVRRTLALPLAWKQYARKSITDAQVDEYFRLHRPHFDGTRVHARQIVLIPKSSGSDGSMGSEAEWKQLEEQLAQIRKQIVAKEISFAEAARKHSQSPTAAQGGDLGSFPYGLQVAREIADVAFALKEGEVSEVFRTRFGVHLVLVSKIEPGQFSLGDVRSELLHDLSDQLWKSVTEELHKTAKVERR